MLVALLGSPTCFPPGRLRAVRLHGPGRHRGRPGRGAAVLRVRERRRRSWPRPTARGRERRRSLAGRSDERRRGHPNVAITGARPSRTTASTTAIHEAGRVLAAQRGGSWPRRCVPRARPPVTGGNVALYNESPAADRPHAAIGVVGLLDDAAAAIGRRSATRTTPSSSRRGRPGLAGSEYARVAGVASEDGPPALDLDLERRLQASSSSRRAASSSQRRTSRRRLRRRPRRGAMWGAPARTSACPSHSPAVDLFGESPSRLIVSPSRHAPAVELLARHNGSRSSDRGVGGTRLVVELRAPARPAPRRSGARTSPKRSTSRSPPSSAPGSRSPARLAGTRRLMPTMPASARRPGGR